MRKDVVRTISRKTVALSHESNYTVLRVDHCVGLGTSNSKASARPPVTEKARGWSFVLISAKHSVAKSANNEWGKSDAA